jgi:hypothetical protein
MKSDSDQSMNQEDGMIDYFGTVDYFEEHRQNIISCSVGWKTCDTNKYGLSD